MYLFIITRNIKKNTLKKFYNKTTYDFVFQITLTTKQYLVKKINTLISKLFYVFINIYCLCLKTFMNTTSI